MICCFAFSYLIKSLFLNSLPKSLPKKKKDRRVKIAVIPFFLFLFFPLVPLKSALTENLLIVEVQIAGEKADNDFIKIYNPSNYDLDITGYKLRKKSSTGNQSSIRVFPPGSKILARGYFLWANSKEDFHLTIGANVWSKTTLAKNNSIALLNPEGLIIDALAWGESQNPFVRGSPFPENPVVNQQLKRKKANGDYQETGNNNQDFYLSPLSELTKEKPSQSSAEVKLLPIIDINTASAKELQKIVGIGPSLAQRIIEARPFYSLDELAKVSGIGPKTLEDIKKQGLAWVNPELEPPKIEKTETTEKTLAAADQSLKNWKVPKSLFISLIALIVAIFSGIIILILKNKLKKNYNKNI